MLRKRLPVLALSTSLIALVISGAMFVRAPQSASAAPQVNTSHLKFMYVGQSGLTGHLIRAKVPGGWLVGLDPSNDKQGPALTFVPDPKHEWDGKQLK